MLKTLNWLELFYKNGQVNRNMIVFVALPVILVTALLTRYIVVYYHHMLPLLNYFSKPLFISFVVVLILTPVMILLAKKIGALDHPSIRKIQKEPIPLLGGIAIYIAFLLTVTLFSHWTPETRSIMLAGGMLLVVGTIDDVYPLSSTIRLIAQLVASAMVMTSGLFVSFLPETWWGYAVASIVTLIWILGITNALNFADGMDGLAAGISVIASIFFFLITLHHQQYEVALLSIIVVGSGIGFLVYNFKPAKVYLGDGGSTFLGFTLACLALYGGWSGKGFIIAFGIPGLILGVLIYDMCYTTVSRIRNGLVHNIKEWLDFTGKDHFHHRLVHLGFKEQYAVIFIYAICIILGLSALVLSNVRTNFPVVVLLIQGALIFLNISILMLVGRKLYLPKDVVEKVLSSEQDRDNVDEFISGDMLKKMLHDRE